MTFKDLFEKKKGQELRMVVPLFKVSTERAKELLSSLVSKIKNLFN